MALRILTILLKIKIISFRVNFVDHYMVIVIHRYIFVVVQTEIWSSTSLVVNGWLLKNITTRNLVWINLTLIQVIASSRIIEDFSFLKRTGVKL